MSDALSLFPSDDHPDMLSMFDVDTISAPVPELAPLPTIDRCPACHGRLDNRSPRCLCAIQPEGVATALELYDDAHRHPTIAEHIAAGRMLPCCGGPTRPDRHLLNACPLALSHLHQGA